MNKHRGFLVLTAILLVTLVGSTFGCGAIAPTPTAKPSIVSFVASPAGIDAGQKTTITWDVSGAPTINIQPGIGTMGPSGSLTLTPADPVTYTLTATNEAGSTTGSVTVTVAPVYVGMPDLVITDVWLAGDTIYFKIKNQGDAMAGITRANLSLFDAEETTIIVEAMAAGEERTTKFHNWEWWPSPMAMGESTSGLLAKPVEAIDVKVCADIKNEVEESDNANNCTTVLMGEPFLYDFNLNAHLALWRSSAGDVAGDIHFGGFPQKNGAAYNLSNYLYTCPQQVSNGWILGRFAQFYSEEGFQFSKPIEVPAEAVFISDLDFRTGVTSTDGVKVALGYIADDFSLIYFPKMDVYSDGKVYTYKVDLSDLKGLKTEFFLWIETKDSPEGDCVRWINPRITQE